MHIHNKTDLRKEINIMLFVFSTLAKPTKKCILHRKLTFQSNLNYKNMTRDNSSLLFKQMRQPRVILNALHFIFHN